MMAPGAMPPMMNGLHGSQVSMASSPSEETEMLRFNKRAGSSEAESNTISTSLRLQPASESIQQLVVC